MGDVDLLKLDIEGAELPVLEQELPRLAAKTVILCELHFVAENDERFHAIAAASGWTVTLLDASHPPHGVYLLRKG